MSEKYSPKDSGDFSHLNFEHQGVSVEVVDEILDFTEEMVEFFSETCEKGEPGLVKKTTLYAAQEQDGVRGYAAEIKLAEGIGSLIDWRDFFKKFSTEEGSVSNLYEHKVRDGSDIRLEDTHLPAYSIMQRKGSLYIILEKETNPDKINEKRSRAELSIFLHAYIEMDTWLRKLEGINPRTKLIVPSYSKEDISEDKLLEAPTTKENPLDKIYGMHSIREDIEEIIASHENADIMEAYGVKPVTSVILTGEAGVGKTSLAMAMAEYFEAEVVIVKASDIHEKWVGASATNMRDVFERAQAHSQKGKVVLILDEFDGITNGSGNENSQNAVNAELKDQLSYVYDNCPDIIVIATTNNEDKIDPVIRRSGRFDKTLYVEMPNELERKEMIEAEFAAIPNTLPLELEIGNEIEVSVESILDSPRSESAKEQVNAQIIAEKTENFSGADIKAVFKKARMRIALKAARGEEVLPLTYEELLVEVENMRR